ncbi:MAG: c-type cytochrome [Gammaproteobacteria bacterium]
MSDDKSFYTTFFYIMGGLAVGCVILIILASNLTSEVAEYKPEEVVVGNIKPVGGVRVAGESEPEPAPAMAVAAVDTAPAGPRSGETVYTNSCMACHASGAAGAPKLGDAAAWATRVAAGKDLLLANAINGLNAMPPKGLCMDCSDDEILAAIDYMVLNSQ